MTIQDLEVHTAGGRDPAGWPRCAACGFRWPCPDLRAALPAQTADEMEIVALIDVGWSVWRARPGERGGWDDSNDIGGVVTGWWEERPVGDDPPRRHYRCLDFPHGQHHIFTIPANEVDVTRSDLPNPATIRRAARKLCAEISKRRGPVTSYELDLLADSLTLMRAIS